MPYRTGENREDRLLFQCARREYPLEDQSYVLCNDSCARCVGGCAVEATSLGAVAERPERPVRPAPLAPVPLGQPEVVAEAASRSEVVGSPSYCSEDAAKRQGSVLIPMPGWGSWELIQGQVNANSTTPDAASNHRVLTNWTVGWHFNVSARFAIVSPSRVI